MQDKEVRMIKIRKYQEKDKEQIKELVDNVLKEIFKKNPSNLKDLENIKNDYAVFLIAEDKEKLIGTIALIKKWNSGILKRLYIKKGYRKKGIAQKLYNKIEYFCKKNKIRKIKLSTTPEMEKAIKFYKKNKYQTSGAKQVIVKGKKYKMIYMKKEL